MAVAHSLHLRTYHHTTMDVAHSLQVRTYHHTTMDVAHSLQVRTYHHTTMAVAHSLQIRAYHGCSSFSTDTNLPGLLRTKQHNHSCGSFRHTLVMYV
ncbi:hypothetical protein BgiMline_024158 [Biomphalaria glabrata]|nr:hypothetical protein BgiMline_007360 [Biomphalaria glabrata]